MYGYVTLGRPAAVAQRRIEGVWFMAAVLPESGILLRLRRRFIWRKLRHRGVRRCVMPEMLEAEAARWGILPVEVCRLRQALLPQLLDRQGDLRRKTAALQAEYVTAAVAEAAVLLARRVRYLSLEIGSGREVLERILWERFGLTVCGVGQAAVTVSFGGAPSGNTICLGEDCRRYQRLTYRLMAGELENEVPEQLLAVLFEAGEIKKEQIRVKTIEPNA